MVDTVPLGSLISPSTAHLHVDMTYPYVGEITNSFVFNFAETLHHVDGHVSLIQPAAFYGDNITNIVWDSAIIPATFLIGIPTDTVVFTGHATYDVSGVTVKHGWLTLTGNSRLNFTNGDREDCALHAPMFSMLNPSLPEQFTPGGGNRILVTNAAVSSRDKVGGVPAPQLLGFEQVVQINGYLPILHTISTPITDSSINLYGYGDTSQVPFGTGIVREDMDLHHGIVGTLLASQDAFPVTGAMFSSIFTPANLGSGTHKVAMIWQQTGPVGPAIPVAEQASALLVVTVNVAGGTPPPPPPPPPMWMTVSGILQQLMGSTTQFRLCPDASLTNCRSLIGQ